MNLDMLKQAREQFEKHPEERQAVIAKAGEAILAYTEKLTEEMNLSPRELLTAMGGVTTSLLVAVEIVTRLREAVASTETVH